MRHNKRGRKLGRTAEHRKMLMRNLLTSLILYNRIETTVPKSKELVSFADKFLNKVKDGSLSAKRHAFKYLNSKVAGVKLFSEVIKAMGERKSGFVRAIKTYQRKGDAAPMAIVEFTFITYTPKTKKSKEEKAKGKVTKKIKEKLKLPGKGKGKDKDKEKIKVKAKEKAKDSSPKKDKEKTD